MTAEVLHEGHQLLVVDVADEPADRVVGVVQERRAQVGPAQGEERLVALVRHLVDVAAERIATVALERRLQLAAVLRFDDVPV